MPTTPRRRRTFLVVAAALLVMALVGCDQSPSGPTADQQVGPVRVEVPRGWDGEVTTAPQVVAQARFVAPDDPTTSLQVVVGCGDEDADALTIGAASRARGELTVTDAQDAVSVEVAGLDAARRTTLTFGAERLGETETLRAAGLYGSGAGGLLLVEYSAPTATYDPGLADDLLRAVTVDAVALREACAG